MLSQWVNLKLGQFAIVAVCVWSGISCVYAETSDNSQTAISGGLNQENKIQAVGMLDIRPSWFTKSGAFDTENTIDIGARLTPDTTLTWLQLFNTNLFNPLNQEASSGVNLQVLSGAIRTRVNNIWKNDSLKLALGYENRLYLPIDGAARRAGLITAVRNYFRLTKTVSDKLSFTVSEILIPFVNSRPGSISASGAAVANNLFENRVYFTTDLQITEKLSLSLPLMFHQTRTANFRNDAANNDQWSFYVWVSPELDYAINPNLTLGISYYNNDSLMAPDLSKGNFGPGLESGEVQFVLTATL